MSKAIVVLSIILSIVCLVSSDFVTIDNVKYFISRTKTNWYEANRICKAEYGMVLVDALDEEENLRLKQLIEPFMANSDARYWISGTDLGSEGSYYWASSGHNMLFTDWHPVQPDNRANVEHCLEITNLYDFKWNDADCSLDLYFICRNTVSYPLNNCICLNDQ